VLWRISIHFELRARGQGAAGRAEEADGGLKVGMGFSGDGGGQDLPLPPPFH
jgi:hypothetical protein